jgi:hypothetical protein
VNGGAKVSQRARNDLVDDCLANGLIVVAVSN